MQQRSRGGETSAFTRPEPFARSKAFIAREQSAGARNYDRCPSCCRTAKGVDHRRRGPPAARSDERVFGGELRPRAPAHRRRAGRAGAAAGGHVARVLQRSAAAADRAPRAPHRACRALIPRAAAPKRSRRRSRRCASGATRSRAFPTDARRSSRATATSTAARSRSSDFRPSRSIATASVRFRRAFDGAVRRRRRARARDHAEHRRVPGRADAGRSAASSFRPTAISRSARASAAPRRAADLRRDPDRARAAPAICSRASTTA